MSAFNDNALIGASGQGGAYRISRSVRLRSSANAYLNRTQSASGNGYLFTYSAWIKRGSLGGVRLICTSAGVGNSNTLAELYFNTNDTLTFFQYNAPTVYTELTTTQVFRDPSAWYHIVLAYDSAQATAANRVKMYINGVQITAFGTATYPSQNFNSFFNTASQPVWIGLYGPGTSNYFDGYMTEINFVDGQALAPSSFGSTDAITGVWQPKKYAGTYGTNGFYLNFSDNSNNTAATIGKDYSGNGNNWTPNNISVTAGVTYDSMIDVPTLYDDGGNGRGNYCVTNPLMQGSFLTLSNGNLRVTGNTAANSAVAITTFAQNTGKYYWETTITTVGSISYAGLFNNTTWTGTDFNNAENVMNASGAMWRNGGTYVAYSSTSPTIPTYTTGDIIGCALDLDSGALYFSKNGTWTNSGVPTSGGSKTGAWTVWTGGSQTMSPSMGGYNGSVNDLNCGQRPFSYTPPTGFKALNTQNLPEPTISNGANYMAATLYTGTSGNVSVVNTVNGIGFQPDFIWAKARSNAQGHTLVDSVRGVTKYLSSNSTSAEGTFTVPPTLNSNGFTSTTDVHTNGYTYAAWQWRAGVSAVSNTAGSITSTVDAGATQGFSVCTLTAQASGTGTFGHGLGVAPSMVIVKQTASAGTWVVYHASIGNGSYIILNTTAASVAAASYWNSTSPSSTVVTLGTAWATAGAMVAYCFAPVAGYSAFGKYTGNGSADGPFVFLGFRPRFVLVKNTGGAAQWYLYDSSRDTYNIATNGLFPSSAQAETSIAWIDFLSNGFKVRATSTDFNGSGTTYIYACFAENPFKLSLAR